MAAQIGYYDSLKSVAGKVFAYLASITITGTDGKTLTVSDDVSLGQAAVAFTPGITFGGAASGVTYDTGNAGVYIKTGKQVAIMGCLALTSKGSSIGDAVITGLPFQANNGAWYGNSPVDLHLNIITFGGRAQSQVVRNKQTISLNQITDLGVNSALTDANFANNSIIYFTGVYFTA